MFYRDISKFLGAYFLIFAIAMVVPFCIAFYHEFVANPAAHPQPHGTFAFVGSILICVALGGGLYLLGRNSSGRLFRREALVTVVTIWFLTPAVASLPFILSGTLTNPFQAYFEAASGFSTTGATTMQAKQFDSISGKEVPIERSVANVHTTTYVFYGTIDPVRDPVTHEITYTGIEAVGKGVLFWRSLTQWFGGMGIIVLFVAILPALGVGGKMLFQAEVPGPVKESLTPRIKETALQLWKIYLGLTFLEVLLLLVTNSEMTLFEALTVTFSTLSTGGFTVRNDSIGSFHNGYTEAVVMLFMVLGSINFSIYFFALRGKFYRLYNPELFLFFAMLLLSCIASAFFIVGTPKEYIGAGLGGFFSWWESIRYGFFQVISVHTSTGFATANYNLWPFNVQMLMLITMYLGGMSGSTAGGIKVMRYYMLFRVVQHKVESLFRPETVRKFKVGDSEVDTGVGITVLAYFVIVTTTAWSGSFLYILDGLDPDTAIATTTLMINNIGIGFRMSGPMETCAFLSNFGLVFSSILMLLGRLEFLAVLAVLVPAFWKQTT